MSALITLTLAAAVGSPSSPSTPPTPADLVQKLGDKSFRVRHEAANLLVRHGSAAVAALTEGMKHTDPEVSERCRLLLPQAEALERTEKLAQLLADPTAPPPKGLAGLDQFLKITGDSKNAREVYAELMGIFFKAMELREKDPKAAAEEYRQFCDEAYARYRAAMQAGRYTPDAAYSSPADLTFFYVFSGDPRLDKNTTRAFGRNYVLLNGTRAQTSLTTGERSPVMRKLFLNWLENDPDTNLQSRGFQLAAQAKMPEALPIAVKLLQKKESNQFGKAQVMTTLAGLGTKEHIKLLEPYLSDAAQVTSVNFGNGRQTTVQLRDVAMGVSVQLAGQKPNDFGFDGSQFGGANFPSSYIYFGFTDDKARDDAHAKWKDWAAKNLKSASKSEPKAAVPEKK
jgi:HEAT repeat protein